MCSLTKKSVCCPPTPSLGLPTMPSAIAVTIAINNIATAGAEPVGLLLTILAPDGTTHEEIEAIQRDAQKHPTPWAQIIGGHTEITTVVNQTVLSVAAIGKLRGTMDGYKRYRKAIGSPYPRNLGLEGSAILAADRKPCLRRAHPGRAG